MKIELHLLQNFAPSNLNRDDTGAPKDCEFGGYRRARISSQCQKRAVRQAFRLGKLLPEENLAARTKRIVTEIADRLVSAHGHDRSRALEVAAAAIEGVGLGRDKKGTGDAAWKTEYLLFVPRRLVTEVASVLHDHWAEVEPLAHTADPSESDGDAAATAKSAEGKKKPSKKDQKKDAKAAYPKEVRERLESLLESGRETVDLALFGRMIADKPDWNVEAACQVAHAISTNKVQMDFDFFTAVDDLKPGDTAASDMMGTVQFNSSCFYRYAVLDVDALAASLDVKDAAAREALVKRGVEAFVRAFTTAIPTGKQNTFAAHNFPSYALAVIRSEGQPISLANAFLKPARPRGEDVDLVDDSIAKLEGYFARLTDALGPARTMSWADRDLADGSIGRSKGLDDFFRNVVALATGAP